MFPLHFFLSDRGFGFDLGFWVWLDNLWLGDDDTDNGNDDDGRDDDENDTVDGGGGGALGFLRGLSICREERRVEEHNITQRYSDHNHNTEE